MQPIALFIFIIMLIRLSQNQSSSYHNLNFSFPLSLSRTHPTSNINLLGIIKKSVLQVGQFLFRIFFFLRNDAEEVLRIKISNGLYAEGKAIYARETRELRKRDIERAGGRAGLDIDAALYLYITFVVFRIKIQFRLRDYLLKT